MSDRARNRINAAFDDELSASRVPPSLRSLSLRHAVTAPPRRSVQPQLLAVIATIVVIAVVATFVIGTHVLRSTPAPAKGSAAPPAPRVEASVAYDQAHGQMVIFGGNYGLHPPTNETWTWDGKVWREALPAVSPPARNRAVMAYDGARRNVVLLGGVQMPKTRGVAMNLTDTWLWNGSSWRELHPPHAPALDYDAGSPSMAFDPITGTVLLYGIAADRSTQTWSWNGQDWTHFSAAGGPQLSGTMANDGRQVFLVAGSNGMVGGRFITQTWAWTGSAWSLLHPSVELPSMEYLSVAYDPAAGQLVLLGSDTWIWNGSSWSRAHPSIQPPRGYMVYVASLQKIVSWGDVYSDQDSDMWAWNGTEWSLIVPVGAAIVPKQSSPGTGKGSFTTHMTPSQAAAYVRATVTNTRPVLLPVPPAWAYDATVRAGPDDFEIDFQSDLRDKTMTFGILVANPPPGGPNAQMSTVKFRNAVALKYRPAGYAEYFVYDTTAPTSQRYLMWIEPGITATNPQRAGPGLPYFLSATGLTDQEFWQVANSLQ
jgi:hypothetical protein